MENNSSNNNNRSSSHGDSGDTVEQAAAPVSVVKTSSNQEEINERLPEEENGDGSGGDRRSEEEEEEEEEEESGSSLVTEDQQQRSSSTRTPFTNLSQIDADLALARTLQEQERAYMMLSMNNDVSDYGSWETGSYLHDNEDDFDDPNDGDDDDDEEEYDGTGADHEEDAFDVHAHEEDGGEEDDSGNEEIDPGSYSSDEAYARALQEAEERDMAARLFALAGIHDRVQHTEDQDPISQDAWEEVDPDELSYEELLALGEVVGTESRGLSADTISSLPSVSYKAGSNQNGTSESCVICRLDYEDGDNLIVLSCKHSYHSECINNWLKINKVCPVCSTEVSTSGHS